MRYLTVLLLALALGVSGSHVLAHTLLDTSEPPDGANLSQPVRNVRLVFGERVTPLVMRVLQPNGEIIRLNDVTADRNALIVHLPDGSAAGTTILSWRVMADDGHPVGGTVTFSVLQNSLGSASDDPFVSRSYRIALWLNALLLSLCVTAAVGGATFRLWIVGAESRWLTWVGNAASLLGLLAGSAGVVIQTLDGLGDDPAALRGADLWWTLTMTPYGRATWLTAAALVMSLAAIRSSVLPRALSLLGLACACAAFVITGHASQATPRLLVYPGVMLHVAGMLIWFGALLPLLAALRRGDGGGAIALARFSAPILVTVIILPATGLLLAVVQLQNVTELWSSAYGVVLLIKLALLVPLFTLGAINRFILTPAVMRGAGPALHWITRSVKGEVVLAVLLLGVVGLWRFTPPPREMASVRVTAGGLQLHAHGIAAMVNLTFTPARVGKVTIRLSVLNLDATFLNARSVDVALFKPGDGMRPIRRVARRGQGAGWDIDDVDFDVSGRWQVRVDVAMQDTEKVYARTSIDMQDR